MSRKLREFVRPADVAGALAALRRPGVRTRALMLPPRVPDEPFGGVEAAVDLGQLGLAGVTAEAGGGLRLGAQTTLQALAESAAVRALASGVLAESAHLAAGSALRNAATLGGAVQQHLGAMAGMTRDGPPEVALALLVLEAVLVVEGAGQTKDEGPRTNPAARAGAESRNPGREMALADYYATGGMLAMDELLVAVRLPSPPTGAVAALARVARTPRDQAIVAAVALVAPGVVRVALAGATPKPMRLGEVEARLAVQALTPEVLDALPAQVEGLCEPRGDFRASAEYRRAMAGVLVRRALAQVTRPAPLRFGDHDDG